ncbi:MAG TPA: hypothetical protein V6C57_19155 [Coleofasciculaceae cyanobacterium]
MRQLKAENLRLRLSTPYRPTALGLEILSLAALLILFLLLGCVTASRLPESPGAMVDEILFTDPAANLYLGHGFTSSAWFTQTQGQFWAGYPPLYPFLLSLWMHCVGFTIAASRALNYILGTAAGFLLWFALFRLGWIQLPIARITLIALFLTKLSSIFDTHTGRPDGLAALLAVAGLFIYSIPRSQLRYSLLICLGILLPLTGLQLIPYAGLLGGLLVIYYRKAIVKEAIALAVGILLGGLCLYGLYSANGVWLDFINSIRNNPSFTIEKNSLKRFGSHWASNGIYKDVLYHLLLTLLLGITGSRLVKSQFQLRSRLSFGLASGFVIPLGMIAASCYPIYYSWMAFLPVAIVLCAELGLKSSSNSRRIRAGNISNGLRIPIVALLLSLCLIRYPLKLTTLLENWHALSYSQIETLVNRNVKSSDWVLCHEASYYATKTKAAAVMTTASLRAISPQEAAKISVLIIKPQSDRKILKKLGGQWDLSGEKLHVKANNLLGVQKTLVKLKIYRRKEV